MKLNDIILTAEVTESHWVLTKPSKHKELLAHSACLILFAPTKGLAYKANSSFCRTPVTVHWLDPYSSKNFLVTYKDSYLTISLSEVQKVRVEILESNLSLSSARLEPEDLKQHSQKR